MNISEIDEDIGQFDTVLMLGNNSSLLENLEKAKVYLKNKQSFPLMILG